MTICLAISCFDTTDGIDNPCILFAADTQESGSYVKRSTTKLKRLFGGKPRKGQKKWRMAFAMAGDALVADEAIEEIMDYLHESVEPDEKEISLTLLSLRTEVGNIAFKTYDKYKKRGSEEPEFELFIGAADTYSVILYVNHEGKTRRIDKFGVIGTGGVTGGELLLGEFFREDLTEKEAADLAAMVVSAVARVDMFVGGEPDMYVCKRRTVLRYGRKKYSRVLREAEVRWKLLKKTWTRTHHSDDFEEDLQKLLKAKKLT